MVLDVSKGRLTLLSHHLIHSELWIPVGVCCPTRSYESSGGWSSLIIMVDNEPVIMSVTMKLGCHSVLESVDDPSILSLPSRQTALQRMVTQDMNFLTYEVMSFTTANLMF